MNESTFLRETRTTTRIELQRENLLEVLRVRSGGDALAAAVSLVKKQNDLTVLSRWFKSVLTLPPEAILAELEK